MRRTSALIALVAVAVVLGGLVFSGAISDILYKNADTNQEPPHAPDIETPNSWSELVADGGVSVETTVAWTADIGGEPTTIRQAQNGTVTLVYRNRSVRLDTSDGSVINRTRFGGTVVEYETSLPVPLSYRENAQRMPVVIQRNGTYYRFNVSSWSRTKLANLSVEEPRTGWVNSDGIYVKRNDSTVFFLNVSTGNVTNYGKVSAKSFAVDGDRTLIYANNYTYARFPNGTERRLFPNGTKRLDGHFKPTAVQEEGQHVVAANQHMVVIAYPKQAFGSTVTAIYDRDTAWFGWSSYFVADIVRLSGKTAQTNVFQFSVGGGNYAYKFRNITKYEFNQSTSGVDDVTTNFASIEPVSRYASGVSGEYSYITSNLRKLNVSYVGVHRNGTVWHLKVDEGVGTVHELAVSPDRRSVIASNGSAVFKLRTNRSLEPN